MTSIGATDNIREAVRRSLTDGEKGRESWLFHLVLVGSVTLTLLFLAVLLIQLAVEGSPGLTWSFLNDFPSRIPANAGIFPAVLGTAWMLGFVLVVGFPLGVATAIYLEEYAMDIWLTRFIRINIQNLAGVPSIVYGLLGLAFFVRFLEPVSGGRTVIAGGLTLSLLVLPLVVIASVEALRAVPPSISEGGLALGASRWEVVRRLLVPAALPGILTGVVLAVSRAVGETAPLITIGALTFVNFAPTSPRSGFTTIPIQAFHWISQPQSDFQAIAASAIVVLMMVGLAMNVLAVILRTRFERRW